MDKEKFVQRVENMIYHICGCSPEEAVEVLKEALKRAKTKKRVYLHKKRLDRWKKKSKS